MTTQTNGLGLDRPRANDDRPVPQDNFSSMNFLCRHQKSTFSCRTLNFKRPTMGLMSCPVFGLMIATTVEGLTTAAAKSRRFRSADGAKRRHLPMNDKMSLRERKRGKSKMKIQSSRRKFFWISAKNGSLLKAR